jgi:hypothetical protein
VEKRQCNKCKKRFTRQWNLQRHLKSIHNISDYGKNDIVKQKYYHPIYSDPSTINNEHSMNPEHKMSDLKHDPSPSKYHNFTNRFYSEGYYNNWFYQNYELFSIEKKEPKLTIQDGIRIQTALRILKNVLPRFYPYNAVIRALCWLNYQCNTKHSDQPLKDFYKKYNIWYLWPSKGSINS